MTDADRNGRARTLERAAWIILLAVIALRPMLAETHSSAQSGIASVLTQAGSSGPGVTVVLDAALLVAMILIAVAGLLASGDMEIEGVECLDGVYPGFFDSLVTLKGRKK